MHYPYTHNESLIFIKQIYIFIHKDVLLFQLHQIEDHKIDLNL